MGVNLDIRKVVSLVIILTFLLNTLGPVPLAQAQVFRLPAPGVRVDLSAEYDPPILKGIKVHPDNPFHFDFILDQGDSSIIPISSTATRLIKYFLAGLTIPEKDLWVNLSPYEKDRIVPNSFGLTEMGRDLLAEDYMLKQITASLIYPEGETGKRFWKRVYEQAAQKFGTTSIPVNTFNKVWIVPEKAVVYENAKAGTAYVVESKLKVMLEQDYLSMQKHMAVRNDMASVGANIIREIVIPELTKEVNEDKNFSQLRQVYNSLILATWYKKKIKDSILERIYANRNKVKGLSFLNASVGDPEHIYQQYLQAFKKGVYNYIKEEQDPVTQETIPRKYFSGGVNETNLSLKLKTMEYMDPVQLAQIESRRPSLRVTIDLAMSSRTDAATASPTDLPESFNFQEFVKNDVIAQLPNGTEEERMRYSSSRIRVSIPNSLIFNTTLNDVGKFYIDFILRELLLNALNAQQEGQIEISFKNNVIYIKNEGNLFSRMWEGYHRLLDNHMLWVAHDPADGSIIDFISKGSLPSPESFKEGSEGYITAVKEKALYSQASEDEVNKLFKTPEGRNLLFFLRKYISFSGIEGTQGYGIFVINGLSNKLGARLLLVDDGEKAKMVDGKKVHSVLFAIKFSNEASSPVTFTDQSWVQLKADLDKSKAIFSDPSVSAHLDALINNVMSIGEKNGFELEVDRLKALETNGSFKDGFVDEQGRLIRNNGPTIKQMRDQHKQLLQVKGKRFEEALAAKLDEEYSEALDLGAKANNPAELKRHSVNLLEVAMTIKNRAHQDAAMINQSKPAVSVSRGIRVEVLPNVSAMSYRVARGMADTLISNNKSGKPTVFICPTGGTQDGIYAAFVSIVEKEHIDFTNLNTFNMDEYYVGPHYQGNWAGNPQSYRYYMEKHLFSELRALNPRWDEDNTRIHFLNGQAPDIREETARYEKEFQYFRDTVGIDFGVGGIGRDGHIAFNEPIIPVLDSKLMDDQKIIDFNEFWVKADKSNWGNAIHRLLYRHWSLRETPVITNYLENEFLASGIEVSRENVYLLSKKLISQKVTIYLNGLQASDIAELDNVAKDAGKTFRINRLTVEFKDSRTIFNSRTHAVQLSIPTIIDNSRFFSDLNEIPLTALTIGLGTMKDAKKIIIAATGPKKQEAVYSAVAEPESPEVSASSLQRHKNVTFVIDTAAGGTYWQSHAGKSVQAVPQESDQAMIDSAEELGVIHKIEKLFHDKDFKGGLVTIEGMAGAGKSFLKEWIKNRGIVDFKSEEIDVIETDAFLPSYFDLDAGVDTMRDFRLRVQSSLKSHRLVIVAGAHMPIFFREARLAAPDLRVYLDIDPWKARMRVVRRDRGNLTHFLQTIDYYLNVNNQAIKGKQIDSSIVPNEAGTQAKELTAEPPSTFKFVSPEIYGDLVKEQAYRISSPNEFEALSQIIEQQAQSAGIKRTLDIHNTELSDIEKIVAGTFVVLNEMMREKAGPALVTVRQYGKGMEIIIEGERAIIQNVATPVNSAIAYSRSLEILVADHYRGLLHAQTFDQKWSGLAPEKGMRCALAMPAQAPHPVIEDQAMKAGQGTAEISSAQDVDTSGMKDWVKGGVGEIQQEVYRYPEDESLPAKVEEITGIQKKVIMPLNDGRTVFISDDHNHAYSFWWLMMKEGKLKSKFNKLLHIDAHPDAMMPKRYNSGSDIFYSANSLSRIDEESKNLGIEGFIAPLAKTGFISEWHWLYNLDTYSAVSMKENDQDHQYQTDNGSRASPRDLDYDILDIDIDVLRGEPPDRIEAQLDYFAGLAKKARVISIVTSPGFIDQNTAISYAKRLVSKISDEGKPEEKLKAFIDEESEGGKSPFLNAEHWFLPYARAGFSERELRGVIHKALNNNSYGLSGSMGLSRGRESQMETIIKGIHEAVAAKEKNLTITTFGAGVSFNEPVDTLELALQELKKKSHAIKRITLRYYDNNPYILDSISRNLPGEINSFLSKNNKEWIGKINVEVFYADILDIADNLGDHRWRQVVLPSHIMILRHTWILKQGFGEFDETVTQTEPFRVRFKNISEFVNVLWNKIPVGTLIVQESTGMNAGPEINIKKIKYKKDRAMVVKNGGIDLTPANMNLRIQNGGAGIKFYLDPAMLQRLQNAPGFVPVIVNVQPMTDLRQFLGIQEISVDN